MRARVRALFRGARLHVERGGAVARPVYCRHKRNDIDWCMGRAGTVYSSTVAIAVGVAAES